MKRNALILIWTCSLSLLLCACVQTPGPSGAATAEAVAEAAEPPVLTDTPPLPTAEAAAEQGPPDWEAAESTAEPTDPATTQADPPEPPFRPLPGDTTAGWDPSRAEAFPSDADCSPWQFLTKWMRVEGLAFSDLDALGCRQLLLVSAQADGVTMRASCYERRGGDWLFIDALRSMHGWVGANGIAHNRRRYSDASPAGLWSLGPAFGNAEQPEGLRLAWRDVTPQSDWVCDADSVYFNTWQERNDPKLIETWDYDDAEHLEDYPRCYAYACVIGYNLPPDPAPDRGCAIFLHCATGPTGGCIGLPEQEMRRVLTWLDPEKHPYILISGSE